MIISEYQNMGGGGKALEKRISSFIWHAWRTRALKHSYYHFYRINIIVLSLFLPSQKKDIFRFQQTIWIFI